MLKYIGLPRNTEVNLLRVGTNLIFSVPQFKVVLRASRGEPPQSDAFLKLINELSAEAPILPPLIHKIIECDDWRFSVWPMGENADLSKHGDAFASALDSLHQIRYEKINYPFPKFTPLAPVQNRLDKATNAGAPINCIEFLRTKLTQLSSSMDAFDEQPGCLLHGDAHIGNAVIYRKQLMLIDLDDICYGPWQLDFIPAWTAMLHMDESERYLSIVSKHQEEINEWPLKQEAIAIRELTMTSWLASLWGRGKRYQSELLLRYKSLSQETNDKWSAI